MKKNTLYHRHWLKKCYGHFWLSKEKHLWEVWQFRAKSNECQRCWIGYYSKTQKKKNGAKNHLEERKVKFRKITDTLMIPKSYFCTNICLTNNITLESLRFFFAICENGWDIESPPQGRVDSIESDQRKPYHATKKAWECYGDKIWGYAWYNIHRLSWEVTKNQQWILCSIASAFGEIAQRRLR